MIPNNEDDDDKNVKCNISSIVTHCTFRLPRPLHLSSPLPCRRPDCVKYRGLSRTGNDRWHNFRLRDPRDHLLQQNSGISFVILGQFIPRVYYGMGQLILRDILWPEGV